MPTVSRASPPAAPSGWQARPTRWWAGSRWTRWSSTSGRRPRGSGLLGAEAELFGNGADGGPTADDWARAAGTINYEIVTRISPRVPRRFINEDQPAGSSPGVAGVPGTAGTA